MKIEYRFDDVRERSVTYVVEQRGDADGGLHLVRDVVCEAKLGNHAGRQVKGTEAVRKPRMLGRLIRKICEAKLSDAPQPLKLGRVDQRHDKAALVRIGIDTNYVMNRVAVNSLGQVCSMRGK